MSKKCIDVAYADETDLNRFVELGIFKHYSEAHRDALRRGIQDIKKERGIGSAKEQEDTG